MLREMTIGQYYPVDSPIHRLDPRVKIIAVFIYLISLFVFSSFTAYIVVTAFLVVTIAVSKVPFSYICKGLRPILFLLLVTACFNIFGSNGDEIFHWRFIVITWQGLRQGIFMSMRLIYLIMGSSMLTYTTTPNKLTDGLESIFKPLEKINVPVQEFAMMMCLALRFIPILLEETNRLITAQKARGADFDEGGLLKKMKGMAAILVPLIVSSVRRAYDLSMAMESRCYHGGKGRTKMKPLQYEKKDYLIYVVVVIYFVAIILINKFIWL